MEQKLKEVTEQRDKLNDQIAGYRKFELPIDITDEQLEVRIQEGDTKRFEKFAKQSLIQGLTEEKLGYKSLDDITESMCDFLEEMTGHKRWLCIIRPSIGDTGLCAAFRSALTYSFSRNDLEYKVEII